MNILWYITNFYSDCRNRFYAKYHLIDTGLDPKQWHDLDSKLIGASKKLTVDFVEKELKKDFSTFYPPENEKETNVDLTEYWKESARVGDILQEIYKWWTVDRPILKEKIDDIYKKMFDKIPKNKADSTVTIYKRRKPLYDLVHDLENDIKKADTNAAIKLVEIRESLWT